MDNTYDMAKLMARIKQTIGEEKYHLQSAVKHILHTEQQFREVCKENEDLRSALKVICTWGHMDIGHPEYVPHLVAEDVVALCDKVLGRE